MEIQYAERRIDSPATASATPETHGLRSQLRAQPQKRSWRIHRSGSVATRGRRPRQCPPSTTARVHHGPHPPTLADDRTHSKSSGALTSARIRQTRRMAGASQQSLTFARISRWTLVRPLGVDNGHFLRNGSADCRPSMDVPTLHAPSRGAAPCREVRPEQRGDVLDLPGLQLREIRRR